MTCTLPVTASTANSMCEAPPGATATSCDCTLSIAPGWWALVAEDADAGDADLRALLPHVAQHVDDVAARGAA